MAGDKERGRRTYSFRPQLAHQALDLAREHGNITGAFLFCLGISHSDRTGVVSKLPLLLKYIGAAWTYVDNKGNSL